MPQLDPAPWFTTFTFSWLVFLSLLPSKVAALQFPNEPTALSTEKPTMGSWNWPWY